MASPVEQLKAHLKNSLLAQYVYRKWVYPSLQGRSDTDQILLPELFIRTGIDVGANAGAYALMLAPVCQRLLCFEPVPFMGQLLHKLLDSTPNTALFDLALSNANGTANLSIPVRSGGSETTLATLRTVFPEANNLQVRTARLDDFWAQHPRFDPETVDFIKIDVEGAEGLVLEGMQETIARSHPVLLVEIELRHNPQSLEIFNNMAAHGYSFYVSRIGGTLEQMEVTSDAQLAAMQNLEHLASQPARFRHGDTRAYLNNFWFIHPQSALAPQLRSFMQG